MAAIISNDLRIFNADTFAKRLVGHPSYVYIGKDDPWVDEELPDNLTDSTQDRISVYQDLLALKRIEPTSVQSVCPRVDWIVNTIYDQFDHRTNMIDSKSPNTGDFLKFYVLTDEFNVYKCLSNNNGVQSTIKPTSQQLTEFQTSDGYIWKYMYTVRTGDVFNFLSPSWMPVYTLTENDGSSQWLVQQNAVDGAIHVIVVETAGIGYSAIDPPQVVITGDGTGATATVVVNVATGAIEKINVTNKGSGYSFANVSFINVGIGVGATATSILSPIGGHGKDARSELGGTHKMVKLTLTGNENGTFPVGTFRKAGIISDPMSIQLGSRLVLSSSKLFSIGDTITGSSSLATGTIREIAEDGKLVWIETVVGDFSQGEIVTNQLSQTATISSVANDTLIPLVKAVAAASEITSRTGKLLYLSNREFITRSVDQSEDVRFVISF